MGGARLTPIRQWLRPNERPFAFCLTTVMGKEKGKEEVDLPEGESTKERGSSLEKKASKKERGESTKKESSAKKDAASKKNSVSKKESPSKKESSKKAKAKEARTEETGSKRRRAKEGLVTVAHKAAALADPNLLDTDEGARDVPDDLKADPNTESVAAPALDDDDDDANEPDLETIDEIDLTHSDSRVMTLQEIKRAVEAKVCGLKNSLDDQLDEDGFDEAALDENDPDVIVAAMLDHIEPAAKEKLLADTAALDVLRRFVSLSHSSRYASVVAMQAHLDGLHADAAEGLVVRLSQLERDLVVYRERNRFAAAAGFQPLVVDDIGMGASLQPCRPSLSLVAAVSCSTSLLPSNVLSHAFVWH